MARMPPPYFGQQLASSPSSSSSAPSRTWSRYLLTAATTYCVAWGAYYLAQDTLRRTTVRRRRRRHHRKVKGASRVDDKAENAAQQQLNDEERQAIEERFASTSILGRYVNPFPEWREQGVWEFIVWKSMYVATHLRFSSDGGIAKAKAEGSDRVQKRLTLETPQWAKHRREVAGTRRGSQEEGAESWVELSKSEVIAPRSPRSSPSSSLAYTWIGQSTFLLTLSSRLTILTDPVFGVQPIPSIFSPTRLNPQVPATLEDILTVHNVRVDVVVVSHNHFDHFDARVVPLLPATTRWVVPKGMKKLLEKSGVRAPAVNIFELDWWQEAEIGVEGDDTATLHARALPAMHWTARTGLDTNQSLWCSYSLELRDAHRSASASPRVFFSGDTGYSPSLYRGIGAHSGPFDVAFLPIGSYAPRWHMRPQHVSPHDSVAIARDIGATKAVGMHWGTWIMSDEHWEEPALLLEELAREGKKDGEEADWFETMRLGETREWATRE